MLICDGSHELHMNFQAGVASSLPFVFSAAYREFIQSEYEGSVLYAHSTCGSVCAPIHIFRKRMFRFGRLLHPPLSGRKRLSAEHEWTFLNTLVYELRNGRWCDRLVQPPNHCIFAAIPDRSIGCRFGTYVLDLQRPEDVILAGMHRQHRKETRQAERRGVYVSFGENELYTCHELYAATMRRSRMSYDSLSRLQTLYRLLSPSKHIVCAVAYGPEAKPVGGLLTAYTRYAAFCLYGGSAERVHVSGAIKLLHWKTIQFLRTQGVQAYNFVGARLSDVGGTKLEHIQRFKARFGATLEEGYLWKMDIRPARARLFDSLVAMKRRFDRRHRGPGDIIDQERRKEVLVECNSEA